MVGCKEGGNEHKAVAVEGVEVGHLNVFKDVLVFHRRISRLVDRFDLPSTRELVLLEIGDDGYIK